MAAFAAAVLAGGAARRMNGVHKPALPVAGRAMLHRVLAAVAPADPCVVVGPRTDVAVPGAVRWIREDPPGGGPVAAIAAGIELLDPGAQLVAVLAADLPLLTTPAVLRLYDAVHASTSDGAVYVDDDGRRQSLCGMWRVGPLRAALARLAAARPEGLAGASMRGLLGGLTVAEIAWPGSGPPPWFDCDTDADLRRAEEWAR
ncbi:Molybdopterin-guanine dinucleotide biosynthesis protein A [Micromonospora pattaloongensis]|uniref:Molybdopterin-guanine dinucleotide biosynthesis protein A n=1 Tax=Micromonospora pattaloongensis TaxID=405436 RepID=A0A1H3HRC4_9ACTN|nr:NTP transferase domain-containing protein [Micromonospora pattaloongensis]SDY17795.1 Molybdopterin-guanine dinucleotide biosynthesis protein A [Micromonospora pattaloongensis]